MKTILLHAEHQVGNIVKWINEHIVYIKGTTLTKFGPFSLSPNLSIQTIEFMYTHDKFINQAIKIKQNNQTLLITPLKQTIGRFP